MKKNDWKILIATIAYTILFYNQQWGLNALVFSILMVLLTFLQDNTNIKKVSWLSVSAGTIISGYLIFQYATSLPKIANTISLIFLAGISIKSSSSLIIAGLNSFISLVLTIPSFLYNKILKKKTKNDIIEKSSGQNLFKKILLLLFPFVVVLIFFSLYKDSNPLFQKITEDINLEWLSIPLIRFFLVSLLFVYAFFVQTQLKFLNNYDDKFKDEIDFVDEEKHKKSFFSNLISLESEIFTGVVLLSLLNVLIAFLNGIDINYLWLKADLPEGLVFSEYIHSGTFTLILTILMAIGIIIFFFRGFLNFNKKGKWIKILGYLWIIQNIVMIVSAMLRNKLYIDDYGMTHKRIGVYIFLLLSLVSLIVTVSKIILKKNTLFLIRKNTWAFYAVLIIGSMINWDMLITNHNIKLANNKYIVDLDKEYLTKLSHVNTYLLTVQEKDTTPVDIYYQTNNDWYGISGLQQKIQNLLDYENRNQWQEKCINKDFNIQKLKKQNEMRKLSKLDLYSSYLGNITQYPTMSNIKGIDLRNNHLKNNLKGLALYKDLEVINLGTNQIEKIDSFPFLGKTKYLNLSNNHIQDFNPLLNKIPNISHLNISNNSKNIDTEFFPILDKLETIDISNTNLYSWDFLAKQKKLEKIIFTNASIIDLSIKKIESLKIIDLSYTKTNDSDFLDSLSVCKNIEELILSNSSLNNTIFLLNQKRNKALFNNLKTLDFSFSNLQNDILALVYYNKLENLNLSNNMITKIEVLETLLELQNLNLSNNNISKVSSLNNLEKLVHLNLSTNSLTVIDDLLPIKNLENLNLSNNQIKNIDSIYSLEKIIELDISNNKIRDISALKNMKKLTHLYIENNFIKDYSPIFDMPNLKYLSIGTVDSSIIIAIKKALPNLELVYYSRNLNMKQSYNNNKRRSYIESF